MIQHSKNTSFKGPLIIPRTEGIKYAGSKLKILPYIVSLISDLQDVKTVLDGFSGTTRVSQALAQMDYCITSNDIALWSQVFATCYLKSEKEDVFYQEILNHLNSLKGYDGWFTEQYGGLLNESKKPFQRKNTQKLDAMRDEIDKLGLSTIDTSVIVTSLLYALDTVDNTLGHHVSYLSQWSKRSYKDIVLTLPKRFPLTQHHEVIHDNIFNIIQNQYYDIAYFDPPYGSNNEKMPPNRVRYNAYCYLWKTIILHDKPKVFGKAYRREDSRDTKNPCVFEEYKKDSNEKFIAMNALNRLIEQTNAHYIILSYSSGGRATKNELIDILRSNGTIRKIVEIDYKKNVMSQMKWTNQWIPDDTPYKEFLFLLEK